MSKILIVVTDTNVGGVTTAVYNFINELCKRDNDVTFLDFSAKRENPNIHKQAQQIFLKGKERYWKLGKENVAGAPLIKKPLLLLLGILKKLTIKGGLWNKLIFSKLDGDYDVAIAYRQCAPCYSFVLNKVNAKKKIGFVHGDVDYMGDISSWQPMMTRFNKIAYVSDTAKRHFINIYPELRFNATTIYNMFDYESMQKKADMPNPINFDLSKKNIVTIARIDNSSKQIDWIVRICAILKENLKNDFHWYILGNGPDMDEICRLSHSMGVSEVLTLVGAVENPYAPLKDAYLGVLTSRTEGYCMTVIETLSLGVPMVNTYFESVIEQMTDKVEGIIVEQRIESVANAVQDMINNKNGVYDKCKDALLKREFNNDLPYEQFIASIR